jgi:thiol-disulfide isomerase/thioredoxin
MAKFISVRRCVSLAIGAAAFGIALYGMRPETPTHAEDTAAAAAADPFAVPETDDPAELLKFIDGVRASRPPQPRGPASYREYVKYNRAAGPAIARAAKKILSIADKKSEAYAEASGALLESQVTGFSDAEAEERVKILDEVIAHLKEHGVREAEASIAYGISQAFERLGDTKTASRAYKQFGELVKTSEVERIRELESAFSGPGRRLGMVGSEMEVFGKTLDGEDFDFSKYKGKVVLVDFWATWCGPCIAELPNVKEAYEKYHDKGFEVIGVSLDERRFALDQFLEKNELPWVQLHEEGGPNKLAAHYGVNAIPFIALVGRDGKVVSVEARGRQLHHELEKIFGPAEAESGETESGEAEAEEAGVGE